jgi:hypothetical protein
MRFLLKMILLGCTYGKFAKLKSIRPPRNAVTAVLARCSTAVGTDSLELDDVRREILAVKSCLRNSGAPAAADASDNDRLFRSHLKLLQEKESLILSRDQREFYVIYTLSIE